MPVLREILAETLRQAGRQAADEGLLDRLGTQRAADHVPQRALLRRQIADVFREQVDLHPRRGGVGGLAAAVHRAVVARVRLQVQNLRVDIVREHAIKFEMEERLFHRARGIDRLRDEFGETRDRAAAVIAGKGCGLIHIGYIFKLTA